MSSAKTGWPFTFWIRARGEMIRMTMRGVRQTVNEVLFVVSRLQLAKRQASGQALFSLLSRKLPVPPCSFHVALLLVILGQCFVGRPVSLIELERFVQPTHPIFFL